MSSGRWDPGRRRYQVSLALAAERTGLSYRVIRYCLAEGLVAEPLGDAELAELRRIRRLRELGINLAGIEVILHMRRRLEELQAELAQMQSPWDEVEEVEEINLAQRLLPWRGDEW